MAALSDVKTIIGGYSAKRPTEVKMPRHPAFNELDVWVNKIGRNLWAVSPSPDDRVELSCSKNLRGA